MTKQIEGLTMVGCQRPVCQLGDFHVYQDCPVTKKLLERSEERLEKAKEALENAFQRAIQIVEEIQEENKKLREMR